MIESKWLKSLTEAEKAQYMFGHCEDCDFYPCERVEEFRQFAESHPQDIKSKDLKEDIEGALDVELLSVSTVEVEDFGETEAGRIIIPASVMSVEEYETKHRLHIADMRYYSDNKGFSYDHGGEQKGCIMAPQYVAQIECGNQTVTDGISDHYKVAIEYDYDIKRKSCDRWEPDQPVYISAQTGQGKNYFIEKKVIPYVKQLACDNITKQKVLILSNRLALRCQINQHILNGGNLGEDDEKQIYSYGEYADVMTYQGLLFNKKRLEDVQRNAKSRYIFVICDEAHFFTADAMFNPDTDKILQSIVTVFRKAIRIYMTATPYECLGSIMNCEKHTGVFYHFQRDYSYLNVVTYSEIEELYGQIISSIGRKEKWLIFIDDKKRCRNVKESLERLGKEKGNFMQGTNSKIYAIDAESKKDDIYRSIIEKEKLPNDVYALITTSVLDNGVNLYDIDNIVVSDMLMVKCLQMVGRARVRDKNDLKTLYIKRPDKKYIQNRIYDLEKQKEAYHYFELAYGEVCGANCKSRRDEYNFLSKYYDGKEEDWRNAKHWFGRLTDKPNQVYYNSFARSLMEKYLAQYELIYQEMEEEENALKNQKVGRLPGQKYLEYQLSWFGKQYCADDDITLCGKTKAEALFTDFLDSHVDKEIRIKKADQKRFREEFAELYDNVFGREDKNQDRTYGINKMNKVLQKQKLNYQIQNTSDGWEVVRVYADSKTGE